MFELGLMVFISSCIMMFLFCIVIAIYTVAYSYSKTKKYKD